MKCKDCESKSKKARDYKRGGKKMKKAYAKGKAQEKVSKVMEEYKTGALHSGSKKGPMVTNRKQAIAIALSEAHKAAKMRKKK